ncbi:hypothetical protein [Bosea sp. Root381]|uniref:hypothetical protein n=1 Tax=Bosea sp. Root381 TaxID=1736524 RepID=UPI0012E3C476|nr:hypothetical protein [Bosea sp. Root381]
MVDQTAIIEVGIKAIQAMDYLIGKILDLRPPISDQVGPPYLLISNPTLPEAVEALCHYQALAYSCLFDDGARPASEGTHFKKLRLARVAEFRRRCPQVEINHLRNRGFRNAIAHFDERYLKLLEQQPNDPRFQDLALSHRSAINIGPGSESRLIRVICYDENRVYLFGESINIVELRAEGEAIIRALGYEFDRNIPKREAE